MVLLSLVGAFILTIRSTLLEYLCFRSQKRLRSWEIVELDVQYHRLAGNLHCQWGLRIFLNFVDLCGWCAALVTMTLPKGKDFRNTFNEPPHTLWACGAFCACCEM